MPSLPQPVTATSPLRGRSAEDSASLCHQRLATGGIVGNPGLQTCGPKRFPWLRLFGVATSLALTMAGVVGCANMVESRAIEKFATNLDSANLTALKTTASKDFNEKALRTADAMDDLKILNLPSGKSSVVKVEEIDPKRKRVTVEVGEQKKEIFYELVLDEKWKEWVVDDVFMKQRKKGVTAYKSVTEQMDLLLSVREGIESWNSGEVDPICDRLTPEFAAAIRNLPEEYRVKLTAIVAGKKRSAKSTKPEASLDDKTAVVRLPRERGETVWTLQLQEGHWLVSDIAIDSKEESEQIPSVYKQSLAVLRCVEFLDAYATHDREVLKPFCSSEFYEGAIALGELSLVNLPRPADASHTIEVKIQKTRADFTLTGKENVIHVAMHRQGGDIVIGDQPPVYEVSEVSVYDIATNQEQHLTAVFTAQAMLELFAEAISQRDVVTLRQLSTHDFTKRVWSKANDQNLPGLPLDVFNEPEMQIVGRKFEGALTRFFVVQGGQELTYYLREQQGQFRIDDIEWKVPGRPASVKMTAELLIPLQNFAFAISLGRDPAYQQVALEGLQKCCSDEFNRIVWRQTRFVPNSGMSADTFMATDLKAVVLGEGQARIILGDHRFGAEVRLIKEGEQYAIDEILLIAGAEEAQRLDLRRTLRTQLAEGTAQPPAVIGREEVVGRLSTDGKVMRDSQVVPAGGEFPSGGSQIAPKAPSHVESQMMPGRLPVEPLQRPTEMPATTPATPAMDSAAVPKTQVATPPPVAVKPATQQQTTADWANAQFDAAFDDATISGQSEPTPTKP
ncbi:MAG: hypothetical protein C0478_07710 [Planctomyces sp.]|nr:hypothetical protein [Planctomyces sp.]